MARLPDKTRRTSSAAGALRPFPRDRAPAAGPTGPVPSRHPLSGALCVLPAVASVAFRRRSGDADVKRAARCPPPGELLRVKPGTRGSVSKSTTLSAPLYVPAPSQHPQNTVPLALLWNEARRLSHRLMDAPPSGVVQLPPSQRRRGRDTVEPPGRPDSARPPAEQGAAGRAGSCRGAAGADSAGSGGTRTRGPTLLSSSPCEAPGRPVSNRGRMTATQPAGFGERLPLPEAGLAVVPASSHRRGRSPVWLPRPAPLHALSMDPQRPGAQPRARPPPGPALRSRSERPGFPSRRHVLGRACGRTGRRW
ncbi:microtubule-associated protein tau-like [Mustela erminea]|uniref:microtubule-associated protein tau-like n=1 Tax=Mustela erminea TaxID=36723 RepID=UPI001386975F|nr:microtubule-associated protein tau-like [Mustela erminea]